MSVTKATEANKITEANPRQRSKNTPEEAALVARAWAEGKSIQLWLETEEQWIDRPEMSQNIAPSFADVRYRVKPEPRVFELWINSSGNVLRSVSSQFENDYRDAGWTKIKAKEII